MKIINYLLRKLQGQAATACQLVPAEDILPDQDGRTGLGIAHPEDDPLREFMGVMADFLNSPAATWTKPGYHNSGILDYSGVFARYAENIPSFQKMVEEFRDQAKKNTVYAVIPVRWPYRFRDYREKGLETDFLTEVFLALPERHPWRRHKSLNLSVTEVIHGMRGCFDYKDNGVFIIGMPTTEIEKYFVLFNDELFRVRSKTVIPAKHIITLLAANEREERFLEAILRAYWKIRRDEGYLAKPEYPHEEPATDPRRDKIPRWLERGVEIGLDGNWDARGAVEGMHRLFMINRVINTFKKTKKTIDDQRLRMIA